MITDYPYFRPKELYKLLGARKKDVARVESILQDYFGKPVVVLNSARTGAYIALAAKKMKRTDEVFVQPYMSKCILDTITECAVPSLSLSAKTKAILVVHQYGYPQDMDSILNMARERDLLVIEDSAFSFGSRYKGKMVGSFGTCAIFSFPKAFSTILGGCLVTEDADILAFAREYLRRTDTGFRRSMSTLALLPSLMENAAPSAAKRARWSRFLTLTYSQFLQFPNANKHVCRVFPRTLEEFSLQIEARKKNLAVFRAHFGGTPSYPHEVEADSEVVPFVAPYFGDVATLERIDQLLLSHEVETRGVHHFDRNRTMLSPEYVPMLRIPVHQHISETKMNEICELIARAAT